MKRLGVSHNHLTLDSFSRIFRLTHFYPLPHLVCLLLVCFALEMMMMKRQKSLSCFWEEMRELNHKSQEGRNNMSREKDIEHGWLDMNSSIYEMDFKQINVTQTTAVTFYLDVLLVIFLFSILSTFASELSLSRVTLGLLEMLSLVSLPPPGSFMTHS